MCSLEKRGNVFILTLTGECKAPSDTSSIRLGSALARVRSDPKTRSQTSVLVKTAQCKFFPNALGLVDARGSPDRLCFLLSRLRYLLADFISLPMLTVAAVKGYASAGGFLFALSHDYIVMRKDRGFLYMSEMDIGVKVLACFLTLIRRLSH